MSKIMLIFGTRPEAIKMSSLIRCLRKRSDLEGVVCVTAQHRQMLDQVLRVFNIRPDYDLDIMKTDQDLFDITSNALMALKNVLIKEQPDMVLVQGDTTTAFIAGLAAFYLKIPTGHVEAGLRTHNKYSPFPEEKNRQLLSVLTDYHFAPTDWAKSNLLKEGVPSEKIWVTGNTVVDALVGIVEKQKLEVSQKGFEKYFLEKWNITIPLTKDNAKLILVTGHRRENFGEGFENICLALKEIAEKRKDLIIIYPVHLNPYVRKPVKSILGGSSNIYLIDPLDYEEFVFLLNRSYLILTDSGGIQEEAPSLGKPVLVMRDTTERPEGIAAGKVKLIGTDKSRIVRETIELIDNHSQYNRMSKSGASPYGDGRASEKILDVISKLL